MSAKKKQVRRRFREAVFRRDGFRCQVCGRQWTPADAPAALGRMDAHHITDRSKMPNGGYVAENGITVCQQPCHMQVEQFHLTGQVAPELHPDALYRRIGSSMSTGWFPLNVASPLARCPCTKRQPII